MVLSHQRLAIPRWHFHASPLGPSNRAFTQGRTLVALGTLMVTRSSQDSKHLEKMTPTLTCPHKPSGWEEQTIKARATSSNNLSQTLRMSRISRLISQLRNCTMMILNCSLGILQSMDAVFNSIESNWKSSVIIKSGRTLCCSKISNS